MPGLLRQAPVVFLDDARLSRAAPPLVISAAQKGVTEIVAFGPDDVPAALAALDQAVAAGKTIAGYFAYELGAVLEPRAALSDQVRPDDQPLIWLLVADSALPLHVADRADLFTEAHGGHRRRADLTLDLPNDIDDWFSKQFDKVQAHIRAGDVYQINLTFDLRAQLDGDPLTLYQRLRQRQPAPYAAYIDTGTAYILSLSPELFVRRRGAVLTTSPMKGTAPRGATPAEDALIREKLLADPKTRAENLMIVDLLRNDLSKLSLALKADECPADLDVRVDDLFKATAYPSLWQMTSDISARLGDAADITPSQLLAGLFPCGSVTGAPKIRAMQIIDQLEGRPRGVYCGAIGYFRGTGAAADWCLNVPIRTLCLNRQGSGRLSVGAGLVADSDHRAELAESLLKSRFAKAPAREKSIDLQPRLIETMAVTADHHLPLLVGHLERLQRSAMRLGYEFDARKTQQTIFDHVSHLPDQPHRLRLLLDHQGGLSLHATAIKQFADIIRLGLSAHLLEADDPMRAIKSTARGSYATAAVDARAAGMDDMLFLNTRGELADSGMFNIWLRLADGTWRTPILESGALPGVMRAYLLQSLRGARAEHLRLSDLKAAESIWVSNAVRGLLPARLMFNYVTDSPAR